MIKHPHKLFIGGNWVDPVEGGRIVVVSPDTERVEFEVAEASAQDMDLAVAAARDALDNGPWGRTRPAERVAVLQRMLQLLEARDADFREAGRRQIGLLPSLSDTFTRWGRFNVEAAIQLGGTFEFEQRRSTLTGGSAYVVHEPVGVVAAIAPWNAPYHLMTCKLAPALLAGCTIVMKPSPETPVEAYILAECAEQAGVPAGVLNLVPAGREAGDHLIRNPGVDKVAFTGSTTAGRHIASVCGERVARCSLELGGKSAAIVLDDMPIQEAAHTLARTITRHSGQICVMLTRALVSRKRHDELAEAIRAEMATIRVGHADDPEAQMGPLASKRQLERVEAYVRQGREEGAKLLFGGDRPAHLERGYFFNPTLFADVDNAMSIAQEEIFGPVLVLIPYDDVEDAIRIANDSKYGLGGAVLTHDSAEFYRVARRIRTGKVDQNGMLGDFLLPFGGFKQSGIRREGGAQGLMEYLETKTIILTDPDFRPESLPA